MRQLLLVAALSACSLAEYHNTATLPRSCPWGFVAVDAGFATGTLIAGGYLLYTAEPGWDPFIGLPRDVDKKFGGTVLLLASAAYIVSGAYGYSLAGRCEDNNEQLARAQAEQETKAEQRERAWTLTRDAEAAARSGDCAKVLELDARVRELDADLHATVFRADVAISRCLAGVN